MSKGRTWQRLFPAEQPLAGASEWSTLLSRPVEADDSTFWTDLARAADSRFERPCRRPGVLIEHLPGNKGVILSHPESDVYVQLAPEDLFLWQQMDGVRTQIDLVVAYTLRYKAMAPARVAALVELLRAEGLLADPPDTLYSRLQESLPGTTSLVRLNRLTQTLLMREFAIGGIDDLLSRAYQAGGWLLYTRPVQAFLWLVATAGLVAFLLLIWGGDFSILGAGTVVEGAVTLTLLQLLAIFLHELAHAFTVKAYGRRVRRAGLLLLYGLPGAFVDTTDIWPAGKRAQLAVTWAGPFSNLVLGGAAALTISANPGANLASLVFQFAVSQYILVVFNLTPFIRLDGYYMLADWLEVANLRTRAFGFLRFGLPSKIRLAWQAGRLWPDLSREEHILTIFGALSVLWIANFLGLAVVAAPVRLAALIGRIFDGTLFRNGLFALFFTLTGILLTTLLLVRSVTQVHQWLRKLERSLRPAPPWRVALIFAVLALLVAAVPSLLALRVPGAAIAYSHGIALAAAILIVLYSTRLSTELQGAYLRLGWRGLFISGVILVGVNILVALQALAPSLVTWPASAWPALRLLALMPALIAAALTAPALLRLRTAALGWSLLLGVLSLAAFVLAALPAATDIALLTLIGHTGLVAALLLHWQLSQRPLALPRVSLRIDSAEQTVLLARAVAAVIGEVAQAHGEVAGRSAFLQLAARFNRRAASSDWPLWLTMDCRLGDQCTGPCEQRAPIYHAALTELQRQITASLGPAFAADARAQALAELPAPARTVFVRWLSPDEDVDRPAAAVDDDRVRLRLAGRRLAETLVIGCARIYGWLLTEEVIGGFNRTAGVAGWPLYIRGNGRVADELQGNLPAIAQTYTEALQSLLGRVAAIAGIPFVERGVVQVYDTLPWEVREVAGELLFGRLSWARNLSRGSAGTHLTFLRTIPLLSWLAADDLIELAEQLRPQQVPSGRLVLAHGAYFEQAPIVHHGALQAIETTGSLQRVMERRDSGALVGLRHLLEYRPAAYDYIAQSDTELWWLPREAAEKWLAPLLHLYDALDEQQAVASLLARIPLFASFATAQRTRLIQALKRLRLPPGHVVLEQGEENHGFFIVRSGELEVLLRTPGGGERHLSMLAAGEVFGETALLNHSPATATVRTRTAVDLLNLTATDFYDLLGSELAAPLNQIQSRRAKERDRLRQMVTLESA